MQVVCALTVNVVSARYCTIGGGQNNKVDKDANFGFIRGGKANWCYLSSPYCSILGGQSNVATGDYCSLGGGIKNKCYSNYGSIPGGYLNMAAARFSTVLGGSKNSAKGRYAMAAGFQGETMQDYSAVFAFDGENGCSLNKTQSVKVCADGFFLNGVDYSGALTDTRRLEDVDCKTSQEKVKSDEERLATYERVVSLLTTTLAVQSS